MEKFDVIVVGCGPAGVAACKVLKDSGISFCAIDRSSFPREKLCGGGLTHRSVRMLNKLGLSLSGIQTRSCRDAVVYARGVKKDVTLENPVVMVERVDFDSSNFSQVIDADHFRCESVTGVDGNILATDKGNYEFRYLIFADGVNGFSRKYNPGRDRFFCVEFNSDRISEKLVVDFSAVEGGYGWLFPKASHTNIGLGGRKGKTREYKKKLCDFALKHGFEIDESKIRGYHIPLFSKKIYRKSVIDGKIVLTGDAAGLTDACSGEGIYYALASGYYAGKAVAKAIKEGTDVESTYLGYTRRLCKSLSKRLLVNRMLYSGSQRFYIRLALGNRYLLRYVMRVFS